MGQHQDDPIERWTAKRRGVLVLRILKGETSVAEAARQHGLTVSDVETWQDQFLLAAEKTRVRSFVVCWRGKGVRLRAL